MSVDVDPESKVIPDDEFGVANADHATRQEWGIRVIEIKIRFPPPGKSALRIGGRAMLEEATAKCSSSRRRISCADPCIRRDPERPGISASK